MIEIHTGDCRHILPTLDAGSVQCCVTSPPYFGLRDYNVAGQIGLESTVEAYVAEMVSVFREVRRVLRDNGVLWLNLGDSYAGSKVGNTNGLGGSTLTTGTRMERRAEVESFKGDAVTRGIPAGLKAKDLIGIPWRVAFALQADGWWLRSDCIWSKPNPMPESVRDRPTKAHEYVFLLTKSERYFWDADGVREPMACEERVRFEAARGMDAELQFKRDASRGDARGGMTHSQVGARMALADKGGRNLRTVWTIATKPFKGSHFAVFPPDLAEICVKSGSRPGDTVLDPFGGAGTVGLVADRLGRDAVLIELNPDYAEMARQRIRGDAPLFAGVV